MDAQALPESPTNDEWAGILGVVINSQDYEMRKVLSAIHKRGYHSTFPPIGRSKIEKMNALLSEFKYTWRLNLDDVGHFGYEKITIVSTDHPNMSSTC